MNENSNKDKYFIIMSLDAVGKKDFKFLKELPNFKFLLENSSYSFQVQSVYPSLTYPAHTTIVTGKYPKNHKVINNFLTQPTKKKCDWFWYKKYIKGQTIYDIFKKQGLTTCAILWPVTANANIDFNIPEILPHKFWHNQIIVSLLSGSKYFQYDMNKQFGYMRNGINQPNLDNFSLAAMLYTIKTKKPNLTMIHLTDVDSMSHKFGVPSENVDEALKRHDKRLGAVLKLLKDEDIINKTNLIVLGDHSFMRVNKVIKLNKLFLEENLLETNKDNLISKFKVYMNTCDGSCYIYFNKEYKDGKNIIDLTKDKNLKSKVRKIISNFSIKNDNCIEHIYSSSQAEKFGADPNCIFMLEAKSGYYFLNDLYGEIINECDDLYDKGTHGYNPAKENYETFFIASGPNIKKNYNIGRMHLVDEAPTISKMLGETMNDIDGKILENIFESNINI